MHLIMLPAKWQTFRSWDYSTYNFSTEIQIYINENWFTTITNFCSSCVMCKNIGAISSLEFGRERKKKFSLNLNYDGKILSEMKPGPQCAENNNLNCTQIFKFGKRSVILPAQLAWLPPPTRWRVLSTLPSRSLPSRSPLDVSVDCSENTWKKNIWSSMNVRPYKILCIKSVKIKVMRHSWFEPINAPYGLGKSIACLISHGESNYLGSPPKYMLLILMRLAACTTNNVV